MNSNTPHLVVMLTHHDLTRLDAAQLFEQAKDSQASFWGFKEQPLPLEEMKQLYARMKACGKTTFMEVVAYSEAEGMEGARMAAQCGCDVLMGTTFSDSICQFCQQHSLRYMPFVGRVEERPSVLYGDVRSMVEEARDYVRRGAYGVDLLGYRYVGDCNKLISELVRNLDAPVCVAGSIDRPERLDTIRSVSPWAFTIGSAFFEERFGKGLKNQIDHVCQYMSE